MPAGDTIFRVATTLRRVSFGQVVTASHARVDAPTMDEYNDVNQSGFSFAQYCLINLRANANEFSGS